MHDRCGKILAESFKEENNILIHAKSHNFISDIEKWIDILSERYEIRSLSYALQEYQFALLAVVQGQYRQAFISLRLFF